jgi:CelD/BcsL family acetyltransferase involved in cellulose biosynthesis
MKKLVRCETIDAMSAAAQTLLDGPGSAHLFTSRPWFETFVAAGLAESARPLFLSLEDDGVAQALLPCERTPPGAAAAIIGLTSFYSCDFRPVIADQCGRSVTAFALGRSVVQAFAAHPVIGFDSLDTSWPEIEPFLNGLSRPGRALLRYAHFGRWWEDVSGKSFADYMAERGGALREVIRRKGGRLQRDGATFMMIGPAAGPHEVERGITDYETVYAASWKEPEPFPEFQPTLMRNLAAAGWLRLALCHVGGKPVAAQLWVQVSGTATVLKLAHDQAFDRHSPGTVLTHFAIGRLMETEAVGMLDFGRGDDPYKSGWTTNRTLHIGVLSVKIASRPALFAKHLIGALLRRLRRSQSSAGTIA